SVIVPADASHPVDERPVFANNDGAYTDSASNGFLGKVLSAVGLLILGLILGFAAHYLWSGSVVPPVVQEVPVITEQKSDNVDLTSFEEGRRTVDRDPQGYITAIAASPPQLPEDFFLLGRAYFLTGQHWDAKRNLIEAKNRLDQADPLNAKTLAAEIAMALVIIESGTASEAFRRELQSATAAP